MSELLAILGAKHAAEMHLKLGQEDWTTRDWLLHFKEEDDFVVPALRATRKKAALAAAEEILLAHDVFRAQIKIFGSIVNMKMLEEHAAMEDEVVLGFLGHLLEKGNGPAATAYRNRDREAIIAARVAGR